MATKRVQVERLRPQTTQTVFNRPVDTFVQPAPVQAGGLQQLAKFLNDITPQVAGIVEAKEKTETELQLRQLEDMDYMNGEGGFQTLDTLKESGEFTPRNKTVAYAYNKGLGAEIGKKIFTKVHYDYLEGMKDKTIQRMTPEEFSTWTQERVAEYVGEYKDYTGESGVMAGIKSQANRIGETFSMQQAAAAAAHAEEMMGESFDNLLNAALYGIDLTNAEKLTQSVQDFMDMMHSTDTTFSGTELNKRIVGALVSRLQNVQNPAEAKALASAAYNLKAGTGNISGTNHWRQADLSTIITAAIERTDQLEQAQYYRNVRAENEQTAQLSEEIINWIQAGSEIEDFKPSGIFTDQFDQLNDADIAALVKTIHRQLDFTKNEPMTPERYVEIYNHFADLMPIEAEHEVNRILSTGQSRFGTLSLDEMKNIHSISRLAAGRKYQFYNDPFFKEVEEKLAGGYKIWDAQLNKVVKSTLSVPALETWENAEVELRRIWSEVAMSPNMLRDYLEGSKLELAEMLSGNMGPNGVKPGNLNLGAVLNEPGLRKVIRKAMMDEVYQLVEPADLSNKTMSDNILGEGGETEATYTADDGTVTKTKVTIEKR